MSYLQSYLFQRIQRLLCILVFIFDQHIFCIAFYSSTFFLISTIENISALTILLQSFVLMFFFLKKEQLIV